MVGKGEWNRPFAAYSHMVQKPPCWDARDALGQDKQRTYTFKMVIFFVCFVPVRLLRPNMAVFVLCDCKL